MIRPPPSSIRMETLVPYTTFFRSRYGPWSCGLSQQQGIVVGQGAKLDHHLGQRGRIGREARSQRGDVRQPAFVKVLGEKIGKLGLAGPFMGHGQQDRKSTRLNSSH